MAICKVFLVGNAGGEAKEYPLKSGGSIVTFSVAVSRYRRVGNEFEETTDWHRVTVFNEYLAERALKIQKGDTILVTGNLVSEEYEKDGVKHTAFKILAEALQNLGRRVKDEGQQQQQGAPAQQYRQAAPQAQQYAQPQQQYQAPPQQYGQPQQYAQPQQYGANQGGYFDNVPPPRDDDVPF